MRHRSIRIGAVFLAFLLVGFQETGSPTIIRPADGSQLPTGDFLAIAKARGEVELILDGKAAATAKPAADVWTAGLKLAEGPHELILRSSAGERKIRFRAASGAAFRVHPPAAACASCHAVQDGAWTLKGASLEGSCASCHNLEKFAASHSHNTETLAECQMCHEPHGSDVKFHLKMPKVSACKQCHG